MMKHPLFNTSMYDETIPDPREGTKMGLYIIPDMPDLKDGRKRRCQMADCGFRVGNKTWKTEYWNQCCYEDIDYKFYIQYFEEKDPSKVVPVMSLYTDIVKCICSNWPETFYYAELSRHENGFHFIFYFDVERTEENIKKCKMMSKRIIKTAFIKCGYGDIIDFALNEKNGKVFDTCTESKLQLIYLTKNKAVMSNLCTGELKEYDDLVEIEEKKEYTAHFNTSMDDFIIDVEKTQMPEGQVVEYIDHIERWHLYISLRIMYPETYEEEYSYCCDHMTEANGHTVEWYKSMIEGSSWDRDFENKDNKKELRVNKELVKKFGYDVTFVRKSNRTCNIDYLKDFIKI